jgi:hypothetical protein
MWYIYIYIYRMLISSKYMLHMNIKSLINFIGLMDIYLKKRDCMFLIVLCLKLLVQEAYGVD